jgi:hypothetical protein
MRGHVARAFVLGAAVVLAGCASAPRQPDTAEVRLRPAPQTLTRHQVVGEAIVTSLGGASVTLRWLSALDVAAFYGRRAGLTVPWPEEVWTEAPPVIFLLRLKNSSREELQFDPALTALVTQDGRRERAIPYEELYMRMAGAPEEAARMRSLQATLFSRFVVLGPGGQREGLLVFPVLDPKAKHVILELSSFFVGGVLSPGLFEFQVLREAAAEKP